MDNMEINPLSATERLKTSDPREYISGEMFIKTVASLDPDPLSPWDETRRVSWGRLLSENDEAIVATGVTSSETGNKLIIFSVYKKNTDSKTFHNLSLAKVERIADVVRAATIHLSNEKRCAFVRTLGQQEKIFQQVNAATVSEICYTELLESIPDTNDRINPKLNIVGYQDDKPSKAQKEQLERFLIVVSGKLNPKQMDELITEFTKTCSTTANLFSANYRHCFSDIFKLAEPNITSFLEDFASLKPKHPAKVFPVKDLVTTPINSAEELSKAVEDISVKLTLDNRGATITDEKAEFVDLDKVVGSLNNNSFLDGDGSREEDPDYLFKMCQALQAGKMDVCGTPIKVFKCGEHYFVGEDGNHRVVALKALGVKFVPMMIVHIDGGEIGTPPISWSS